MPPKPVIRRRLNLLHLPNEILALIVIKLRLEEVYSLRLTCQHLYHCINTSTQQLLPHGEDYDVIISAKCILTLHRIQLIPLDYVVAPQKNDELVALSKHPHLRCFTLDTTYLDGDFYQHVEMFLASFDINKSYDISFVYKEEESFRLCQGNLILGNATTNITNLLTKLSSFNITSYRGGYRSEISLLPHLSSLEIVKPEKITNLNLLLTSNVKNLHFAYASNQLGGCIFHTSDFIHNLVSRNLVYPNVKYLGPVDIHIIDKINRVFPNLDDIEVSLYSIMTKDNNIIPYQDALCKYQHIIVDTEFYHLTNPQIIALFPQHLKTKIIINRRDDI